MPVVEGMMPNLCARCSFFCMSLAVSFTGSPNLLALSTEVFEGLPNVNGKVDFALYLGCFTGRDSAAPTI